MGQGRSYRIPHWRGEVCETSKCRNPCCCNPVVAKPFWNGILCETDQCRNPNCRDTLGHWNSPTPRPPSARTHSLHAIAETKLERDSLRENYLCGNPLCRNLTFAETPLCRNSLRRDHLCLNSFSPIAETHLEKTLFFLRSKLTAKLPPCAETLMRRNHEVCLYVLYFKELPWEVILCC